MDIYNKVVFMIKQTWNIPSEEKLRILKLHESATKSHYLLNEQSTLTTTGETPDTGDVRIQRAKHVPPDQKFGLNVKPITGEAGSINAYVKDGKVYLEWDGKLHELTENKNIKLPKFWPNPEYPETLDAVDEWEWLTSLNDELNKLDRDIAKSEFFIPSYSKSVRTWSIHYLVYSLEEIKNTKGMTEAEDFLQFGDNQYVTGDKGGKFRVTGYDSPNWGLISMGDGDKPKEIPPREIPPGETPEELPPLNLDSPFKYDQVVLETSAQEQFDKFVEEVKNRYKGVTGQVTVTTSSSIDGDPKQKVKGGITREQYDLELSVRRANAIIQILQKEWQSIGFTYVPNPLGETDKFAPGKTGPNGFKISETAPNRKLIIQLPPLKK